MITNELYDQARASVCFRYKGREVPPTRFVAIGQGLYGQKLHVGHYGDIGRTVLEIEKHVAEQGYRIIGDRRDIYVNPPECNPVQKWQTIVRVPIG